MQDKDYFNDNGSKLGPDEILYNDREGEFFARMKGVSKSLDKDLDLDTTTVATSAIYQ